MYYLIDNYDSFVYNLSAYLEENGCEVLVRRADQVSPEEINALRPEGIILSPGPKRPRDAVESRQILEIFQGKVPILGVCLGHQLIGWYYGADVCHGARPMHGKLSQIRHDGRGLFQGLPQQFAVTRYHSLVVSEERLPGELQITARAEDGVIMGLRHRTLPVYGVQFHPEAVRTEYGHELLENFHKICRSFPRQTERRAG
ncbi:MAG: aminodeoxychorismate/anthranilate synthase component II [Lachnospiraceae bacterium]|nr:aminodeoxychorismate/anthranilate synthase component II [Lachnospiraceae bacterium]MCI1655999.1 aminodeoxychorismate/anthranilate synthase component II [Lachnospiraceae bacterium]MCI2194481.1 aminodeoxychorismate/anthranilate synthase component II [Lachnospiraceae bacterium]